MNILTTSSTRRTFRGLFRGLFGAFLQVGGYSGSFNSSCGSDQGTGGSTLSNGGLFANAAGSVDFTSRSARLATFSDFTGFNHRKYKTNTNNNKRIIILSIFYKNFLTRWAARFSTLLVSRVMRAFLIALILGRLA